MPERIDSVVAFIDGNRETEETNSTEVHQQSNPVPSLGTAVFRNLGGPIPSGMNWLDLANINRQTLAASTTQTYENLATRLREHENHFHDSTIEICRRLAHLEKIQFHRAIMQYTLIVAIWAAIYHFGYLKYVIYSTIGAFLLFITGVICLAVLAVVLKI